jgi:hypothetical protein
MAYSIVSRPDTSTKEFQAANDDGANIFARDTQSVLRSEEERQARQREAQYGGTPGLGDGGASNEAGSQGFSSGLGQFANMGGGASTTMTPTAAAQASGNVGAHAAPYAGGGASGASSAGGSAASGGSSAFSAIVSNPYAWIAAAIAGNELYQNNTGNRDDEKFPLQHAITGRSFYKDKDVWGDKADSVVPGLGEGIRLAGASSSPYDLIAEDGLSEMWDSLKKGGTIGSVFREIF